MSEKLINVGPLSNLALSMLIKTYEANGKAISIHQKEVLSALYELQLFRVALPLPEEKKQTTDFYGEPIKEVGL